MSQTLTQLLVHIIFSTKDRISFFDDPDVRIQLYRYISGVSRQLKSQDITIGGVADHIHILVDLPKTISLSIYVEKIKTSSSKWIKRNYAHHLKLKNFSWQQDYGAFGVSYSHKFLVQKYIQEQAAHHAKFDFKYELIKLLKKRNISFDEKYFLIFDVWCMV